MSDRSKFLKLARARFKQGVEADNKQRTRELAAIRFYNLEQWDSDLLDTRKGQSIGSGSNVQIVPARPSLTIDRTHEPVRQVLNQERQSEMGVELVPADDWGDTTGQVNHDEIKLREGIVRRIQRDSEAADARSWAFERAAIAGRGYYLVMTRYAPGKTRNQEVYVHRIYNQASVTLDPSHEQPDGSDALWGFVWQDFPWDQYVAENGDRNGEKNRIAVDDLSDSDWRALGDDAADWFTTDDTSKTRFARVGDYYYTEFSHKTLYELKDGRDLWEDELPEDLDESLIGNKRRVVQKTIKWAKIDGCNDDVLEETEWQGHYLPFVKIVGEELQPSDKERGRCMGIVEPMMDPCRGFNYTASKFVERVALTTIPPIMMAGGQDEGYESEWDAITTRTLGRVHYNQKDSFQQPAPPPFKSPNNSADVGDLANGLQMFNEAIVSTSRQSDVSLGHIDPSIKSGKLARALIEQSNQGSSNYLDNLKRSMRHEARIINDLLYPIYGTDPKRILRMMDPAGKMQQAPQGVQLTPDAEFNVAVKIAKNTETRRQQITEMLGGIIEASPEQLQIIGDIVWKFADAPEHEELERRYKAVLDPRVLAAINGNPQLPPQIQQQFAQMQQHIQQLQQLADKNATDLQKTQMQEQGDTQRQQMADAVALQKAEIAATAQMSVSQAKVDAENFRSYVDAMEGRLAKSLDLHLEKVTTAMQHMHEQTMQVRDHVHERTLADQQHQQALEQGQQTAQATSDQMVQQAALQPTGEA